MNTIPQKSLKPVINIKEKLNISQVSSLEVEKVKTRVSHYTLEQQRMIQKCKQDYYKELFEL